MFQQLKALQTIQRANFHLGRFLTRVTSATLTMLVLLCTAPAVIADKPAHEITMSSTKQRFDVAAEIKTFYSHLLETNPKVKQQFESLTAKSRAEHGDDFQAADPQIVEWFPSKENWDVSKGFDSDCRYLVIQPVGFGGSRHARNETTVIAEFRVIHVGTTKMDAEDERAGRDATLLSNTLTIRFLGFRKFDLRSVKPLK